MTIRQAVKPPAEPEGPVMVQMLLPDGRDGRAAAYWHRRPLEQEQPAPTLQPKHPPGAAGWELALESWPEAAKAYFANEPECRLQQQPGELRI